MMTSPTLFSPFALLILSQGTTGTLNAADVTAEKHGTVLRFAAGGQPICHDPMEPGELPEGVAASFAPGAHLHPIHSPAGEWSIEPGQPLVSRHRLLVFEGPPIADWIEAQWRAYAEAP